MRTACGQRLAGRRAVPAAVLLLAAVLVSPICAGAAAPPDLAGFWWPGRGATGARMPELTSKLPANGVPMRDLGTPSRTGGNFGELDVKPAARAAAMQWNPMDEETISNVCRPPSIIYG